MITLPPQQEQDSSHGQLDAQRPWLAGVLGSYSADYIQTSSSKPCSYCLLGYSLYSQPSEVCAGDIFNIFKGTCFAVQDAKRNCIKQHALLFSWLWWDVQCRLCWSLRWSSVTKLTKTTRRQVRISRGHLSLIIRLVAMLLWCGRHCVVPVTVRGLLYTWPLLTLIRHRVWLLTVTCKPEASRK